MAKPAAVAVAHQTGATMSRLTQLLRRVEQRDPALAKELASEVKALTGRRGFGLNFEHHVPENVELPGRRVRRGDKVRFLAPSGEAQPHPDERLWLVTRVEGRGENRTAHLVEYRPATVPESTTRPVADLVVVAEFPDPIYPGLRSTGKVERGSDKPYHTVINGENYHALQALLFAYEGKISCIYLDPPYNTRDKDWKYNNDYVDRDDAYRHSKWLAMMERRLKLAKKLLNPEESVLIVTIDEKEVHRLGLLLEQVFTDVRAQLVTIVINPLGQERSQELSRVEEYAFFIFIGNAKPSLLTDDLLEAETDELQDEAKPEPEFTAPEPVRWERLLRGGADATRARNPDLFYPVFIDPTKRTIVSVGSPIPRDMERSAVATPGGTTPVWPIRQSGYEGRWRCSPDYFRNLLRLGYARVGTYDRQRGQWTLLYLGKAQIARIESGEIDVLGRASDGSVILGPAPERQVFVLPKTVWNRSSHRAGKYGTSLLGAVIPGRVFPYPKALYAVEDTLRVAIGNNSEALILDFFAGSGTTAHAVMRLNRQDGGRRRSILVTNNEVSDEEARVLRARGYRPGDSEWEALGICEYITKPRVQAAITGQTPDGDPIRAGYKFTDEFPMAEGFQENAEFFRLTYEDPECVRHDLAFEAIAPLLWMKAGSEGRRIETPTDTYDLAKTYGVLFNLDAAAPFVEAVSAREGMRVAYIVTDDEKQYQLIARELPQRVQPVRLYEAYLGTCRITGEE